MSEDGGEVPARGCTPDEETFGEVGVEVIGILLGLEVSVPMLEAAYRHLCYEDAPILVPCKNRSGPSGTDTPGQA